jgi:hypothetical protein
MHILRLRFRPAWLAAVIGLPLVSLQAATGLPVDGKTVELPAFNVTDSRALPEPEPWLHTQAGRFEVLSSASERTTRRLLTDFQTFQQALGLLWPAPPRPLASSTLILCGKDAQFAPFRREAAGGEAEVLPSRFLRDRESLAIVVNLASERVAINDAATAAQNDAGSVEIEFDHATLLYREYIFSLLNQFESRPPAWMAEGLAQIVMDAEVTDRWLVYGKIETFKGSAVGGAGIGAEETDASVSSTAVVGEQPFNVVLRRKQLMPLGDFFAKGPDSPEARNALGNTLWAKQAYLFLHFCLFGEDLRHRDGLVTFVSRLAKEPLSEQLFRECFKVDYAGMEKQLRAYLLHVRHKYQRYEFKPTEQAKLEFTPATPGQIGVVLGDALRLAEQFPAAHDAYRAAYLRGNREPVLLAGLAFTERLQGRAENADKLLAAACAANVPRPSAHAALARARLESALAKPAGPDGKLSPDQVASVLQAVFAARQHPPRIAETYEVGAAVWAASAVPPKPANLAVLDEGVKAFPRRSPLVLQTAKLYDSIGARDTAVAIAKLGLRFAGDERAAAEFRQLIER